MAGGGAGDGPAPDGKRPAAAGVAVGSCRDTLAQTGADVRTLTFPHKEDTCAEKRAESVAARLHMPARPLTTQLAPLCRTW